MMTDGLELVKPGREHKEQLDAYKAETLAIEPEIHGDGGWDSCETLEEWLAVLAAREREATCPEGFMPSSTFLCIRKADKRLIGFVDIRDRLNDYLLDFGGHIGYSIRPDERGKGYAGQQLMLALQKCREMGLSRVLLTCDESNVRSGLVIQSCGGMLEDTRTSPDGKPMQRWWITV